MAAQPVYQDDDASDGAEIVVNGERFHLGYSRIAKYSECPRAYDFSYNMRLKGKPNAAMRNGTAFHNTLEKLGLFTITNNQLVSLARSVALARYMAEQEDLSPSDTKKVISGVHFWWHTIYPTLNPLAVERKFKIIRGGFEITGRIDWVEYDGTVIDHKFSADTWAEDRAQFNAQPIIYQWAALDQLEGELGISFNAFHWHITRAYPSGKAQIIMVDPLSQDKSDWWEEQIYKYGMSIKAGYYPARPERFRCDKCNFKKICKPAEYHLSYQNFGLDDPMEELLLSNVKR